MSQRDLHAIVVESRARLHLLKGSGDWQSVADRAGLSYRTICALSQGKLTEMSLTREVALAEALGIRVRWTASKKVPA